MTGLLVPDQGLWLPPDPAHIDLATVIQACTPEQLADVCATLDPDDLAIVERLIADIARAGWRSTPATMAAQLDPTFKLFGYTQLLARKFVDAVEGRSIRQVWNLPARYGKSLVASKWGPAWAFDHNPAIRLILASYGKELAVENAVFVRDALRDYDVLGATLKRDRRRQDRFVTTEKGGLIAAGIGSRLTGFGGDGAIVDDPFKDWKEAHSDAVRKKVWDWYRAVLRLRLEHEQAFIIIVMTRWHEQDLSGMVLDPEINDDGEEWEHVRLPALCDDPEHDPLGRAAGEPLEPLRFSLLAVIKKARSLGSYLAAGLEQQRPSPEEGTDVMRGWWKWFDVAPPKFDDAVSSWDMKLKDKETGDFVVGQAWGRVGTHYYLVDQLRGRWDFPTTKAAIVLLHVRNPWLKRHIVENTGNGPEVMSDLREPVPGYKLSAKIIGDLGITAAEVVKVERVFRRGMDSLIPENVKGKKTVRMRAQTGKIEAGHVHVPNYRGIGDLVVDEAAAFPNGAHDDQVDATSQALKRLSAGRSRARRATGSVKTPPPSARATARNSARASARPRQPTAKRLPLPRRATGTRR